MHVERYGTGPEVYFGLHGWSGSHRTFAPLAAIMPTRATLYAADLPGCGLSPAPSDLSLKFVTDEIVEAVSTIGAPPRQLTLIGNCSGAILGLLAARRMPWRIGRLVLIDPFAYWPWYFRVFVAKSFGRHAYMTTFANPFGRWLTNQSLRGHRAPESDLTGGFSEVDHDIVHRYLLMLAEVEGVGQFASLRVPVDIVYGERTFGAVRKSIARWQGIWPQARAWELGGAGHLPIQEATAQLSEIIFGGDAPQSEAAAVGAVESEARI